jgi:hypothetical protein
VSGISGRSRALRGARAKRGERWAEYLKPEQIPVVFDLLGRASLGDEGYDWGRLSDSEMRHLHSVMAEARQRAEVGGPTPKEIEEQELERTVEQRAREWAARAAARAAEEADKPQPTQRRRLRKAPEAVHSDAPTPPPPPSRLLPSSGRSGYVSPRAWRSKLHHSEQDEVSQIIREGRW